MYLDNAIIRKDMEYIYECNLKWHKLRNKRIFISGAYGMLSSYVVFFLMFLNIEYDYNISVVAQGRSIEKAKKRFLDFWDNSLFEYTNLDICKPINYNAPIDFFIHAAGVANPSYYSLYPVEVIEPNVLGTYNLLTLARKNSCEKFVMFSSGDVYGSVDDPTSITETTLGKMDPLDAHSCYGESKRLAETLCNAFYREYNIPTVVARIAHTYGPTMDIYNDPRSFASFMKCAVEGQDIIMYSDGLAKRPFCYLADAVYGYMLLLLSGQGGEAYNVSNSKQFFSIIELAEIVAKVSGNKIKVIKKKRIDAYVENKLNNCNKLMAEKIIRLGWKCHYDIEEGMQQTYNYFIQSNEWN